jgi:hypothetical protein
MRWSNVGHGWGMGGLHPLPRQPAYLWKEGSGRGGLSHGYCYCCTSAPARGSQPKHLIMPLPFHVRAFLVQEDNTHLATSLEAVQQQAQVKLGGGVRSHADASGVVAMCSALRQWPRCDSTQPLFAQHTRQSARQRCVAHSAERQQPMSATLKCCYAACAAAGLCA